MFKRSTSARAGVYPIEEVLPYVVMEKPLSGKEQVKARPQKIYDGKTVHMDSLRYQTFIKSGTTCVNCGLEANYFALEHQQGNGAQDRYHFNLYALVGLREILFTKDHILPRSRGGAHCIDNLQTMCAPCNQGKGNLPEVDLALCAKDKKTRISRLQHKIHKEKRQNKLERREHFDPNSSDGGPIFCEYMERFETLNSRDKKLHSIAKRLKRQKSRLAKSAKQEKFVT